MPPAEELSSSEAERPARFEAQGHDCYGNELSRIFAAVTPLATPTPS